MIAEQVLDDLGLAGSFGVPPGGSTPARLIIMRNAAFTVHAARLVTMTTLLQTEMARYGDTAPLTVANPKPAAWTPPAPSAPAAVKKGKSKAATKS